MKNMYPQSEHCSLQPYFMWKPITIFMAVSLAYPPDQLSKVVALESAT